MRHTVELQGNRKATVEIPYSKLMGNSQYQRTDNHENCCEEKVIQFNCGGCKSTSRSSSAEMQAIIAELQTAYDNDVKALEEKLTLTTKENNDMKVSHALEIQKIRYEYELQLQKANSTAELLKVECKRKDGQIVALANEKEVILRNKINEFKHNQYLDKIRQLQQIISRKEVQLQEVVRAKDRELQDTVRAKNNEIEQVIRTKGALISQLTEKLDHAHRERVRIEEERLASQIKWQAEIKKINEELSHNESRFNRERSQNERGVKARDQENYLKLQKIQQQLNVALETCKNNQSQLAQNKALIQELQITLQQAESRHRQYTSEIDRSNCKIEQLVEKNTILLEKLQQSEEGILILDSQKGDLLIELNTRLSEIDSLKKDLANRQKVVEVKIERVIDGKEEIDQLRKVVSQLEMQLRAFGNERDIFDEELKRKENTIIELRALIIRLEAQVAQLKLYIEKREGSFKWAVEREIEKDMAVTDVKGQIYKVSQVRQYLRQASPKGKNTEGLSEGINAQIISRATDNIYIDSRQKPSS